MGEILWGKYAIKYSKFGFKLPLFHAQKLKNLHQSHRLRRFSKRRKVYVNPEFMSDDQPHEKVKFLKRHLVYSLYLHDIT